jgi:hypothetical protein
MAAENGTWGAPRIHGELLKLGVAVSERTVSRYLQDQPRNRTSRRSWLAFLRNHREAIAAMDLFTVPTVSGRLLYVLFVISHARKFSGFLEKLHENLINARHKTLTMLQHENLINARHENLTTGQQRITNERHGFPLRQARGIP